MKQILFTILITTLFFSCQKGKNENGEIENKKSNAELISGTFYGAAKVLPDNISLGSYYGCIVPPGWQSNFISGQGVVTINKITDSTVQITLSGGPFPTRTYSDVKVYQMNDQITFSSGSYVIGSKYLSLSVSTANSIFTGSPACLSGMPYYSGWDVLLNGTYSYTTHGRAEFTGTKQ